MYVPEAHAEEIVSLQASVFAILALLATAGARAARKGASPVAVSDEAREDGELVGTEIESADEGLSGAFVLAATDERGDRSRTWRSPGTSYLDRLSREGPTVVATRSPLLARVLNDAGYLRAILGGASALLPLLGAVLGVLAVADVDGQSLPPRFGIVVALAVLGVFDALAGVVGVAVFAAGVMLGGGLSSADAARTLLGVSTLWFAAPLIAGTARPLRRSPTMTFDEHWDRTADIVIASLVGAWAVQKILQGLPGLAGLDLPIAHHGGVIAVVVLGALAGRMVVETIAAHWYPQRLAMVQPSELPGPGTGQRVAANALILAVFLFVAVSYLGACWQLWVGGALFVLPKLLALVADRLPTWPAVQVLAPQGIVQTVLLLVVGVVLGSLVLGHLANGKQLIRDSFVVLSLPSFVVGVLELLGGDGPDRERELRWYHQLLGVPVLALGVVLALGIIG